MEGQAEIKTEDIKTEADPVDVKEETSSVEVKKEEGAETKTSPQKNGESVKTAEELGQPDVKKKIVRQIEYYFGDVNLPKDKFLQEEIKKDDGWVPMEVMLRFQRLSKLSNKPETIAAALREDSDLMEVDEEGTKVRRSPGKPLPEITDEWHKQQAERTVYCKGFPQTGVVMDDFLNFFQPYGPVDNVVMRSYKDKPTGKYVFKGSVFVLFNTKELADKFLALEKVAYQDTDLIKKAQIQYFAEKKKERENSWGRKVNKRDHNGQQKKEEKGTNKKEFPKGCVLHISGITNKETNREKVKETLIEMGANVAFIKYDRGDESGYARLQYEEGEATKFLKSLEESGKKVCIGDDELKLRVIEGEEEDKFLKDALQFLNNRHKSNSRKGGKRFGGRGDRSHGHGHKRSGSPAKDGATPAKQAAI